MKKWRCDVVKQCCEGYSFIWKSDKLKAIWYEIPRCGSTATKTMFRETPEYGFKFELARFNFFRTAEKIVSTTPSGSTLTAFAILSAKSDSKSKYISW